jgi:hypothetical protein
MIETLYKIPRPEEGKSECYVLVLTTRAASGGKVCAFMAEHGKWNDDLQRVVYHVDSICTEEELTYQNAWSMYDNAKRSLAGKGFIHSYIRHDVRKEPRAHEYVEAGSVSA